MVCRLKRWQVTLCALLLALLGTSAHAQLRIVTYNAAIGQASGQQTARPGMSTVLEAIGDELVNGLARPIDVLLLQEQFSMEVSAQSIVDVLNGIYGAGVYARSSLNAVTSHPEGEAGGPGLVYNTQTVQLINEIRFGTVSGSAQPRSTLRYQLRPVGYDASADFFAYNDHYKSDTGLENEARRLLEAQSVRNNADALGEGTHALYVGDFNIQSSSDDMYVELLSAGPGQAHDPLGMPGSWHDSTSFKSLHTQSPATSTQYSGQTLGGMDDRFDFQLVSGEMLDGEGLSYLSASYHAFGNNGTHSCCNAAITTGTGASPAVLNALMTTSDHLPVVADYQLPASMLATLASVPANVAHNATVPIDVFVQNVANVLNANWADELDYSISVSGSLLGNAAGTSFPLATANTHQIFLDTGTSGFRTGVVTVQASSQSAANSLFQFPVSFTVGSGGGGPVFGVIAKDTFDEDESLLSFTQTPAPGAYGNAGDGFEEYQIGVSPSYPFQLVDDSTNGNSADALGIVNSLTKTDKWFGVTDTVNDAGIPAENPGVGTATWVFDVSGAIDLEVSIDMGAMGDFEATGTNGDRFDWFYQFDNGPVLSLFDSSINEAISQNYMMADGDLISLDDPIQMLTTDSQTVTLTNALQTLTSPLSGLGDTLTIQLIAKTDGGDEGYVFDNLIVEGTTFVEFLEADFNQDGMVDGLDLAEWQAAYSESSNGGDADLDGDTDGADFLIWQRQFGQSPQLVAAATAGAVPEPASGLVLGSAALLAMVFQRSARALSNRNHRPKSGS